MVCCINFFVFGRTMNLSQLLLEYGVLYQLFFVFGRTVNVNQDIFYET